MRPHGELVYCPECGHEVYPVSEPCKNCGYDGEPEHTAKVLVSKNGKAGRLIGPVPF